ncbi:MAG: branched-chain-amino-acid aminotransferase [Lasallia pustulata]|uniref:Branched-chain-amino-acid aminotransferase n=1 Tax=Lasallia pustulata TaxID=136370 RepID=A0A5M8PLX4_9LECA|nr:MAG: branched-chain-amino-acid aminotransferase [Lasallia pustulata]
MSPSAIPTQNVSDLVDSGIKHTIAHSAPSLTRNGAPTALAELDASKLIFTPNPNPRPVPEPNSPEVMSMNTCTDHMIRCTWTSTTGWHPPTLSAYGPLTLMPTASVLHYATTCFEGLKLYRGHDHRLRLFRPSLNCTRMLNSATRISLPAFPPPALLSLIQALARADARKWLPSSRPESFLYLRPTLIGSAPALGVHTPKEATLFIIAPLPNPRPRTLRLLASAASAVRAWPGGCGSAKVGANYGPSLLLQAEAQARGYDQILWLLGPEARVTEAGASNFVIVWRTREGVVEMVTAPLGEKVVLDGVTRRSVLELVGEGWAGRGYFITPVSEIHFRGKDLQIPVGDGGSGKYAALLKMWLKNIMYGKEKHEWGVVVEETPLDA